jgi:DNA mismatch repair protein MutS
LRQVRPRELSGLRATLAALPALLAQRAPGGAPLLDACTRRWRPMRQLADALQAIAEEPAVLLRDGGVIAPAWMPSWTSCAASTRTATPTCWTWRRASARAPAIPNLRVQFNKVHGFYIEVTTSHLDKVPPTTSAGRR